MLALTRNNIVRFSVILLLRVSAVSAIVLWAAPSAVAEMCEYGPVNVTTQCGTACGCYYTGSSMHCTPGLDCGQSCSWGYGC